MQCSLFYYYLYPRRRTYLSAVFIRASECHELESMASPRTHAHTEQDICFIYLTAMVLHSHFINPNLYVLLPILKDNSLQHTAPVPDYGRALGENPPVSPIERPHLPLGEALRTSTWSENSGVSLALVGPLISMGTCPVPTFCQALIPLIYSMNPIIKQIWPLHMLGNSLEGHGGLLCTGPLCTGCTGPLCGAHRSLQKVCSGVCTTASSQFHYT